ncbi:MAG: ATP-dependent DNA helicase RecG, partial [Bacteroidota bacterium]
MLNPLDRTVAYLKGIGPAKAKLLAEELHIHTLGDLLHAYPFRYVDRTKFHRIIEIMPNTGAVQVKGKLTALNVRGDGRKMRLTGRLRDESNASLELVWFRGINVLQNMFIPGEEYICYGPVQEFNGRLSITHPEMELAKKRAGETVSTFEPVYSSTEKLNRRGLDPRGRRKLIRLLFEHLRPEDLLEIIPATLVKELRLMPRAAALRAIHLPATQQQLDGARRRLKFEELFLLQLRLL